MTIALETAITIAAGKEDSKNYWQWRSRAKFKLETTHARKLNGITTKIFVSESMDTKDPFTYAFFVSCFFVFVFVFFFFRFISKIVLVVRKPRVTATRSS